MSVHHPERSSGTFRTLSVVALVFLAAVVAVAGTQSYRELQAARADEARLAAAVAAKQERVVRLERQVERLEDDPAVLDRLAREELGLVGPRDLVILLPRDPEGEEGREDLSENGLGENDLSERGSSPDR